MATEDKTVKITEEYSPDGSLTKKIKEYPPKKTLSDWVAWCAQVLGPILVAGAVIVSIVGLAVGVNQFKVQQSNSANTLATQVAASATQTVDQQRQLALSGYLQNMSDLLLKEKLKTNRDAQAIAQALTYTTVRNLDGTRKGTLVRFLWEAGLINGLQPIISLRGASLDGIYIGNADLSGANLSGAILPEADLRDTDLSGAILNCLDLGGGKKACATLYGAHLNGALQLHFKADQ